MKKNDLLQAVLAAVEAETEVSASVIVSKSRKEEVVFIGKATSPEEMYDTIQHELRHVTSHICEYYGVDPAGESSAYLQGEIGRQMFPAAAIVVCPRCKK